MEWMQHLNTKSSEALFFCQLPSNFLENLRAFEASCWKEEVTELIHPSCCRELIFTEPEVLVSPSCVASNRLYIIIKNDVTLHQKLKQTLQKLQIKVEKQIAVSRDLFQYCLIFTFMHRIAPSWNRVGDFLVQGKKFLQETGKLDAVRLSITVTDQICVSLRASQIKLLRFEIQDFCNSRRALERFSEDLNFALDERFLEKDCCMMLPSTKQGLITSITRKIPEESPFETYDDIRQYWKLMYGIHLPLESCREFYNVRVFGQTSYTYPSYCVRSHDPVFFFRCNHENICQSFLQDFALRMPSICGIRTRFNKRPLYAEVALCEATKDNNNFLTCKPKFKPAIRLNIGCYKANSLQGQCLGSGQLLRHPQAPDTLSSKDEKIIPTFKKFPTSEKITKEGAKKPGKESIHELSSLSGNSIKSSRCSDNADLLRKRSKEADESGRKQNNFQVEKIDGETATKCVTVKQKMVVSGHKRNACQNPSSQGQESRAILHTCKKAEFKRRISTQNVDSSKFNARNSSITASPVSLHNGRASFPSTTFSAYLSSPIQRVEECKNLNASSITSDGIETTRRSLALDLAREIISQTDSELLLPYQGTDMSISNVSGTVGVPCSKETAINKTVPSCKEPVEKKSRTKPAVQPDVDVMELARRNQLKKANAVTLRTWLKEQGVKVKSSSKKEDLVNEVNRFLEICRPEE